MVMPWTSCASMQSHESNLSMVWRYHIACKGRRLCHALTGIMRCRDQPDSPDVRPEIDCGAFVTAMIPESRRHVHRYIGAANVQTDIKVGAVSAACLA